MEHSSLSLWDAMNRDDLSVVIAGTREAVMRELPSVQVVGLPLTDGEIEASFTRAIEEMLSVSIVDVMMGAWRKWEEIKKYTDADGEFSGSKCILPLVEHSITSKHQPSIAVLVNEAEACSITFDLTLVLSVKGFQLTIQSGRITSVQTGSAALGVVLAFQGHAIWQKTFPELVFPGRIELDEGVTGHVSEAPPYQYDSAHV